MTVFSQLSPVQNKLGLIGNPDNVVLHGVGEKATLKKVFFVKTDLIHL